MTYSKMQFYDSCQTVLNKQPLFRCAPFFSPYFPLCNSHASPSFFCHLTWCPCFMFSVRLFIHTLSNTWRSGRRFSSTAKPNKLIGWLTTRLQLFKHVMHFPLNYGVCEKTRTARRQTTAGQLKCFRNFLRLAINLSHECHRILGIVQ